MSQPSQTTTFRLECSEPRAWLVLNSDNQGSRVIEMQQRNAGDWAACADLSAGDYQCRYYCGNDRYVTYFGPAQVAGGVDCGMDTLLTIRLPEAAEPPLSMQS